MNSPGDIDNPDVLYEDLDPETRAKLIRVIELRQVLALHQQQLDQLTIDQLRNPTPRGQQVIEDFYQRMMEPIVESLSADAKSLMEEAIAIKELQALLPFLVQSVMTKVNLPLLGLLHGIDPKQVSLMGRMLQDFYQKGWE